MWQSQRRAAKAGSPQAAATDNACPNVHMRLYTFHKRITQHVFWQHASTTGKNGRLNTRAAGTTAPFNTDMRSHRGQLEGCPHQQSTTSTSCPHQLPTPTTCARCSHLDGFGRKPPLSPPHAQLPPPLRKATTYLAYPQTVSCPWSTTTHKQPAAQRRPMPGRMCSYDLNIQLQSAICMVPASIVFIKQCGTSTVTTSLKTQQNSTQAKPLQHAPLC